MPPGAGIEVFNRSGVSNSVIGRPSAAATVGLITFDSSQRLLIITSVSLPAGIRLDVTLPMFPPASFDPYAEGSCDRPLWCRDGGHVEVEDRGRAGVVGDRDPRGQEQPADVSPQLRQHLYGHHVLGRDDVEARRGQQRCQQCLRSSVESDRHRWRTVIEVEHRRLRGARGDDLDGVDDRDRAAER